MQNKMFNPAEKGFCVETLKKVALFSFNNLQ